MIYMRSNKYLIFMMSLALCANFALAGCAGTDDTGSSNNQNPDVVESATDKLPDAGGEPSDDDTTDPEEELPAPTVSITATPTSGVAPLQVAFLADVSAGSGDYGFAWDFGDGENSTEKTPTHIYTEPGTY